MAAPAFSRTRMKNAFAWLLLLACTAAPAAPVTVQRVEESEGVAAAPMTAGGRSVDNDDGTHAYQWPGVYFETAFHGTAAEFAAGPGAAILRLRVDGADVATLERPQPGIYRIAGMAEGAHVLRLETASESQAGPNRFGGFFLPPGSHPLPLPVRSRRIEFIGDSHTVGYGNRSPKRECDDTEVWSSTDTSLAYGPRLARHYGADYRVHAISGRGVVRNYGGAAGDTLPQAWPFVLFDHSVRDGDRDWQPQVVVIALGTNDFSTPLGTGERWKDRAALRADYERGYAAFVQSLRERWPDARFLLWSTGLYEGEIRRSVQRIVAGLREAGDTRIDYVPVDGLEMGGCHWHPSLGDHARIADVLQARIDHLPGLGWNASAGHNDAADENRMRDGTAPWGRRP